MFELFENNKNINDAKVFMGSSEESRENLIEIRVHIAKRLYLAIQSAHQKMQKEL